MKNLTSLLSFLFLFTTISAQSNFEPGYFINNEAAKTICIIKNKDWETNPDKFDYKLSKDSKTLSKSIDEVKEFGFDNGSKFTRYNLEMDYSSELVKNLSIEKEPQYQNATLFLKSVVEGKANLYSYQAGHEFTRFFYKIEGEEKPTMLVYKSYKKPNNMIGKNEKYKQQLWKALKSDQLTILDLNKLDYSEKKMVDYFVKFNETSTEKKITTIYKKKPRDLFDLNIRPGILISSFALRVGQEKVIEVINTKPGLRIGLEAEFFLPFQNYNWSFIFEPTFHRIAGKSNEIRPNLSGHDELNYSSIELPIGLRYYFHFNETSKIFANIAFLVDIPLTDSIILSNLFSSADIEIESKNNIAFGIGYTLKDKYQLELRYNYNRGLVPYSGWKSKYEYLAVVFGYNFR